MKRLAILAIAALAVGCTTTGQFENRLVRTVAGDRAFLLSLYGPFGLSSELSAKDIAAILPKEARNAP